MSSHLSHIYSHIPALTHFTNTLSSMHILTLNLPLSLSPHPNHYYSRTLWAQNNLANPTICPRGQKISFTFTLTELWALGIWPTKIVWAAVFFKCLFQTSKKKLFVVRDESSSGPARLEYYDSEKKFHSGGLARRCILLKNCFSINAKSDSARHRHMIVMYTEDDCFGIACESESEQHDWLDTMVQLRSHSINSSSRSTAAFSK